MGTSSVGGRAADTGCCGTITITGSEVCGTTIPSGHRGMNTFLGRRGLRTRHHPGARTIRHRRHRRRRSLRWNTGERERPTTNSSLRKSKLRPAITSNCCASFFCPCILLYDIRKVKVGSVSNVSMLCSFYQIFVGVLRVLLLDHCALDQFLSCQT